MPPIGNSELDAHTQYLINKKLTVETAIVAYQIFRTTCVHDIWNIWPIFEFHLSLWAMALGLARDTRVSLSFMWSYFKTYQRVSMTYTVENTCWTLQLLSVTLTYGPGSSTWHSHDLWAMDLALACLKYFYGLRYGAKLSKNRWCTTWLGPEQKYDKTEGKPISPCLSQTVGN